MPATTTVNSVETTEKEYWVNTMHLAGNTNLNAGTKCDIFAQNAALYPVKLENGISDLLHFLQVK